MTGAGHGGPTRPSFSHTKGTLLALGGFCAIFFIMVIFHVGVWVNGCVFSILRLRPFFIRLVLKPALLLLLLLIILMLISTGWILAALLFFGFAIIVQIHIFWQFQLLQATCSGTAPDLIRRCWRGKVGVLIFVLDVLIHSSFLFTLIYFVIVLPSLASLGDGLPGRAGSQRDEAKMQAPVLPMT
ncbi:MAG: hypothetical protein FRX49_04014 [Trebouxia sp. A1-2]|nr:MAG: hypothetical protein FRX49_04014 [Trebouxia sp. A1-2]